MFCDEICEKFSDNFVTQVGESPNLVTISVKNLMRNVVSHLYRHKI